MDKTSQSLVGGQARKKILSGVNAVYNVVKLTLGPEGKNAILPRSWNRGPRNTNDGVTISENILLKDEHERLVADFFKEGSKKTNELVGDGPQPLYSKILTPNGFVKMGDVKVGDEICGSNGTFQKITGVFPKGKKQVFKVHFADGRKVECSEDHLWSITDCDGKKKTLMLKQLMGNGLFREKVTNNSIQHKYFVPVSKAEFSKKKIPLDPYLLGLLIGDGSLSGSGSIELWLGLRKSHVLEKIRIPEGWTFNSKYVENKNCWRVKFGGKTKDGKSPKDILQDLGLLGTKSDTKFIPKQYLYSDLKSRKELLQGLSDTDGHINTKGLLEYSTVSGRLCSDFQELLRGFGMVTHYRLHERVNDNSYSDKPIHRIQELKGYKFGNTIIKIESTGKYTEMRCIKVSNPDNLYFTDDYVLTHNTTTTAVLAGHLINKIFNELPNEDIPSAGSSGKGVRALRKEIKDAKEITLKEIAFRSTKISTLEELEKVSIISIGKEDEVIAKKIAKMVWDIARDPEGKFIDNHIDVVEGYKGEIETEISNGMKFPAKVAHRAFVTKPERFEMVAEDVAVFITNYKLDNPFEVVGLLNNLKVPKIALFAPDFSPMVIKSLIETTKNGLFCYPVKCPALRTEQLIDLAIYTGANVIDKDTGKHLRSASAQDLGFAEKIVVKDTEDREDATLLGGKGVKDAWLKVEERATLLKKQREEAKNDILKIQLDKRIANLSSAVGIIRVGASTNAELLYLKLKIEDGVFSCKAALQEGYVKGGGLCLKEIGEQNENILSETLKEPYMQIQKNAGGLEIGEDVIDPAKVVRLEVEHGISVASQIITTGILVAESREESPGEGYMAIAKAIKTWAFFDARHKGLLRDNEKSQSDDMEKLFEAAMYSDHD